MKLDEYATMFEEEERHWWYRGLREVIRKHWATHVRQGRPRLLDVGCGTGANLAHLRDIADGVGIDFAPSAIVLARGRDLPLTAVASAAALPFADGAFDVVLSCDVINHSSLPDRKVPLGEMRRVLAAEGIVILNLPAYQWLLSSHDRAYQQDRRFTGREVAELMRSVGLAPLSVGYWNTLLFPAAAATRLLRRFTSPTGSDLQTGSGAGMSRLMEGVLGVERALAKVVPLPFGLSIIAVGRRV